MEIIQKELEHNAAIVAKKTAVVASRQDSSRISGILQAQKTSGDTSSTKLPATATMRTSTHLQNDEAGNQLNDTTSSSSTQTLLSKSAGKRIAPRRPQPSIKKRSGITMARDEYDGITGGLESDDDSTLDGHRDFESAAVNDDGESDRDQEAEESDDDDDELGEIVLPHDFHGLFEGLYRAASNQTFRIPKMPEMESTMKTTLFQYVKDHLTIYHDLPKVQQKDLYVAAPSVAYLHCANAATIFKVHDMPNLLEKTKEPDMAIPSTTLLDLLNTLKEQAQDDQGIFDAGQLVGLIDIEKGSVETKRRQGQKIDVTIKIALDILQIVLTIAAVIGETGLEGSSKARSQNEADHTVEQLKGRKKESPRKVDCKFVVSVEHMKKWEFITISNSEMKALRSTADEVDIMVRKNIRHNHLIINRIRTPKIYFLNMHAYSASLMSLCEHDGAHVCGKVLD
ncbi:hypothetical protein BGZ83_002686 [Gryganskiella cystojenkinii]|nr:hypothetical protein BGZ83_002686 [Gryganskiella cystojenkinii]